MAFLEINGVNVPVMEGGAKENVKNIGRTERAFAGNLLTTRRSRKKSWEVETIVMSSEESEGIESIVSGTGDSYACDWSTSDTADRYSSKGFKNSATTYGVVLPGKGLDGYEVVDASGIKEAAFGPGAFAVQTGTVNVLTSGAASCDDVTKFAAFGATITDETGRYLIGSDSIKSVFTAGGQYLDTNVSPPTLAISTAYTATVYIWTQAAISITVGIYLGGSLLGSAITVTTQANKWNKITVTETTDSSAAGFIRITNATAGTTTTYVDGLKLEASSYATAWSGSGVAADTNRAGGLVFDASYMDDPRFTIGCRVKIPSTIPVSGDSPLFELADLASNGTTWFQSLSVYLDGTGTDPDAYDLRAVLRRQDVGATNVSTIAIATISAGEIDWDGNWATVAVSVNSDVVETGKTILSLYYFTYAGVLAVKSATSNAASPWWVWPPETPDCLSTTRQLQLGRAISKSLTGGPNIAFDDFYVVNAALTQDQIQGITLSSYQYGATPFVSMTGDIETAQKTVHGAIGRATYTSAQPSDVSNWRGNNTELNLQLQEV